MPSDGLNVVYDVASKFCDVVNVVFADVPTDDESHGRVSRSGE